jgi:hypothetical protein
LFFSDSVLAGAHLAFWFWVGSRDFRKTHPRIVHTARSAAHAGLDGGRWNAVFLDDP